MLGTTMRVDCCAVIGIDLVEDEFVLILFVLQPASNLKHPASFLEPSIGLDRFQESHARFRMNFDAHQDDVRCH